MFHSPKRDYNYNNNNNETVENNNNNINKKNEVIESDKKETVKNVKQSEKLEFQNQVYNLNFWYDIQNNSIFLELCPKNIESLQNFYYYKGVFTYLQLIKICKQFKMCDSIEEIFSYFSIIFQNKKVFLKINENNSFDIVLLISSITGKEEEVCFPLERHNVIKEDSINSNICNCKLKWEEKEKEINLKFENLEKILRQENYELKNEIYYLKNDINRYIKTIESNKKDIKNLKEQIKILKNLFEQNSGNQTNLTTKNIIGIEECNNNNKIQNQKKEMDIKLDIQKGSKSSDYNKKNIKFKIDDNKKKNTKLENNQNKINKNQEKMKNNKREIYKQMKEENAKKLNKNKAKPSFSDFLKQKKSNIEKNKNKKLTKSYTSTGPNLSGNKIKEENFDDNNTNEKDEDKYESEEENNINEVNNNEDNDKNSEDENNRYNNMNLEEEENEEKINEEIYDSDIKKTKEISRSNIIDNWAEDFNLNVKKLLEDNDIKLRFTEKLNYMNRRIITKIEELQLIENQLIKEYPNLKDVEYNLIYRGSEHGDSVKIFYEKCNETNNLILIKTKDDIKFGGYTKEKWEGNNILKQDNNAFCFCLNKNKIYKVVEDKVAIICKENMGPCFGDKLFEIYDNFLSKGGKCFNKNNCGYDNMESDFEITNGIEEFQIEEIEVYKLKFD